jgi:hypothetical protein
MNTHTMYEQDCYNWKREILLFNHPMGLILIVRNILKKKTNLHKIEYWINLLWLNQINQNPGLFMFGDFINCSNLVDRFIECLVRKGTCDFMQLVQCRPYQVTVGHRFGWLFVVHSWYFTCKITATITGNCVLCIATDGMSFFYDLMSVKKMTQSGWHFSAENSSFFKHWLIFIKKKDIKSVDINSFLFIHHKASRQLETKIIKKKKYPSYLRSEIMPNILNKIVRHNSLAWSKIIKNCRNTKSMNQFEHFPKKSMFTATQRNLFLKLPK